MGNRLMIVRKARRKTQSEVAAFMGINQNTYSYWEKGKHIDSESMLKLAEYFGVSVDFLSGRKYRVTVPPEKWGLGYDEDYARADENLRRWLEYLHGSIQYVDSLSQDSDTDLSDILETLRNRPDMRMLFSTLKGATPADVEKAQKIIELFKNNNHG